MAFKKIESTASVFTYDGRAYVGEKVADYETATIESIVATFKFIGSTANGTTSWAGEDMSTEDYTDEAGNVLDSKVTAATNGIDLEIASTSHAQLKQWLGARDIDVTFTADDNFGVGTTAVGIGTVTSKTLPFGMIDKENKMAVIYPKALITGGITFSDGRFRIKLAVRAQAIESSTLDTQIWLEGEAKGNTEDEDTGSTGA